MDNIEEKIKNLEEWNSERAKVKPFLEEAIDFHNKARREAQWKNYEKAQEFYRKAIENYKNALSLNPKYYLKDILERIDSIIEEHVNNAFNLKVSDDKLKAESGIREFSNFIDNLSPEERRYICPYDIALSFLRIGDLYYEDGDLDKACEFYNKVISAQCQRPFINKGAYFKIGRILFDQKRFKEAIISFVSALSFERDNLETVTYLEACLKELRIVEYKDRFLSISPNEAKKLIMEVL